MGRLGVTRSHHDSSCRDSGPTDRAGRTSRAGLMDRASPTAAARPTERPQPAPAAEKERNAAWRPPAAAAAPKGIGRDWPTPPTVGTSCNAASTVRHRTLRRAAPVWATTRPASRRARRHRRRRPSRRHRRTRRTEAARARGWAAAAAAVRSGAGASSKGLDRPTSGLGPVPLKTPSLTDGFEA